MARETETAIELEPYPLRVTVANRGPVPEPVRISSESDAISPRTLSRNRSIIVIVQLAGINFMSSFANGLVTVGLPTMSEELQLHPNLLLWPMSVYSLTNASCLLLAGAIADVVGTRKVNLVGCFFIGVFILLTAFSHDGTELILFRAMQGIAAAMAIPSSMSIISRSIESGKPRNVAFASLGLAMPLGFSFGMTLAGVFVSGPGWRLGFYIGGAASFLLCFIGVWALPKDPMNTSPTSNWTRLLREIDWIGACLVSASIAMFSYVLAILSADVRNITHAESLTLLVLSTTFAVLFVYWMHRQENLGRPALIPNSIWKQTSFTAICLMILLSNGVVNCMELFSSLFFQRVQDNSALETSLKILPNMIIGIVLNFSTGVFVNKLSALYAVLTANIVCTVAPLLMALINPEWPYWYDAFFAQLLSPISIDVLFTVGILIISDVFSPQTQALAGAVFTTVAQLGTSIGLTVLSLISTTVTKDSEFPQKSSPKALLEGYRASFWTMFAWTGVCCFIGVFGLRKVGKIGQKQD